MQDTTPNSAAHWTDWFTLPRFTGLLALLIFAAFPTVVLGTHSFFNGDFGLFGYPVAHYARENFWRGEIPLWNPYNDCGTPFLAQWSTAVCYPLSLIYILLPLPWSLDYFCLGHVLLAGVAMYALARRWTRNGFAASVAGLAFAFSGLTLNCVTWVNDLAALAWLPLVILCTERAWQEGGRWIAVASITGAVQMLSGAPEIILLTWLLSGMLLVGALVERRRSSVEGIVSRFLFVVVMVAGMCALQLLPFFELFQNADRSGAGATAWAMPPWGLANFLVPLFHSAPSQLGVWRQVDQQWTSSYYVGAGLLALALAAVPAREPRARWLALIALLGVALALGENAFIHPWLQHLLPDTGVTLQPIKFIVLAVFAVPLLAAFVINNATEPGAKYFRLVRVGMLWTGGLLLLCTGFLLAWEHSRPFLAKYQPDVLLNGWLRALFLVVSIAAIFSLGRVTRRGLSILLGLGIWFLLGADLLTHTPSQNPVVPNAAYLSGTQAQMSEAPRLGQSRAMLSQLAQAWFDHPATSDALAYYGGVRAALYGDCNLLDDIPKVNGLYSLSLSNFVTVRDAIYEPTNFTPGLADFLGVNQITAPGEVMAWRARQTHMPLVSSGQKIAFTNEAEILRSLAAPDFDPRRVVYLPAEARRWVKATNAVPAEITASRFTAHAINLSVKAAQSTLLVVAQTLYPCWQASINGENVELLRANGAFQALELPAGKSEVRLVYKDRMFSWGLVISLVSWLVCLFEWARPRNLKRTVVVLPDVKVPEKLPEEKVSVPPPAL